MIALFDSMVSSGKLGEPQGEISYERHPKRYLKYFKVKAFSSTIFRRRE